MREYILFIIEFEKWPVDIHIHFHFHLTVTIINEAAIISNLLIYFSLSMKGGLSAMFKTKSNAAQ
jgi:hypothetical protein